MEDSEFLCDNRTMKVRIYYREWDGAKRAASDDLLRQAVGRYLGTGPVTFPVCRDGKYGKPYITELQNVHFSITHAGEFWACAVGDGEVGLDLQEDRNRETEAIAKRFFHSSEIRWLASHDREEFFRIWAMKESYVKYTGKGLREGLDYFSVVEGVDAFQQEIPFRKDYWMVLTSGQKAEPHLEKLPVLG